jgi:chemotaxis protein MotA
MLVIVGVLVVIGSVLGGFVMAGGNPMSLWHLSEVIVICGSALGALIIMSPKHILVELVHQMLASLKGSPYSKSSYELFLVSRRTGTVALEGHLTAPESSPILTKYPSFFQNKEALRFLCGSLRPVVDGKIKPEQLKTLLEAELMGMEEEHHAPAGVLAKAADAMPGFGIVAAVLGIVITMGAIAGPIEEIGHKVAAALVGTFLGIFVSYGFMNPLAVNIEFINAAKHSYLRSIASAVIAFAGGMAPLMAVEIARRGLSSDVRPDADEMENRLKSAGGGK